MKKKNDMSHQPLPDPSDINISHVADIYNCYPGQHVTFCTRINIFQDTSELQLTITLPEGVTLDAKKTDPNFKSIVKGSIGQVSIKKEGLIHKITWNIEEKIPANSKLDYEIVAHVDKAKEETQLKSTAKITAKNIKDAHHATTTIIVKPKARYLSHLPKIYQDDDLMNRLLMLFESFWHPIEDQIDQIDQYFNPSITPSHFLPWLASWLDLSLNERWTEESRRKLISKAIPLYRKRGTSRGLSEILQVFTGYEPVIKEHLTNNFAIGKNARLGHSISLGKANKPNTFSVIMKLPPIEESNPQLKKEKETIRKRMIENIIDKEKPAYTDYDLVIETDTSLSDSQA